MTSQKISLGRPSTGRALTDAERQARRREKVAGERARLALALFRAKDARDWDAVERIARHLFSL